MSSHLVSFCINTAINELDYIKLLFKSLKDNLSTLEHEIIVFIDSDNQGTLSWLTKQKDNFPNLKILKNPLPVCYGYARNINEMFKFASNDIVSYLQSDMVISKDYDVFISKHIKDNMILSSTRIEPPLHPDGPEKILWNGGVEPEEFIEDEFLKQLPSMKDASKVTEGIFAPWAFYKKEFQEIGGHDPLYAPQSKEDSDIFNRFQLNGVKFKQVWDGFVYHMTSRGSRRNTIHKAVNIYTDSPEWLAQNQRSTRNFIRKWGHFVMHDRLMKPIVPPKYNIGIVIKQCTDQLLEILEPWCDTICVDIDFENYIEKEQKNTAYDLKERVTNQESWDSDITIYINGKTFNEKDYQYINQMSQIIDQSGTPNSSFELGNLNLAIKTKTEYTEDLIKL